MSDQRPAATLIPKDKVFQLGKDFHRRAEAEWNRSKPNDELAEDTAYHRGLRDAFSMVAGAVLVILHEEPTDE